MKPLTVQPDQKDEKMNMLIAFSDDQSFGILKKVSEFAASQNLSQNICLPVSIVLNIKSKPQKSQASAQSGSAALILDFKFYHGASDSTMNTVDLGSEKEVLPITSKYVEVVVLLSGEPQATSLMKK